jgi:hypothetical protein
MFHFRCTSKLEVRKKMCCSLWVTRWFQSWNELEAFIVGQCTGRCINLLLVVQNKKKYRLSKWNMICRPKDQGGLGIEVLDIKNSCLLSKWLFKIINEEGMWQELICNKYLKNKNLADEG